MKADRAGKVLPAEYAPLRVLLSCRVAVFSKERLRLKGAKTQCVMVYNSYYELRLYELLSRSLIPRSASMVRHTRA